MATYRTTLYSALDPVAGVGANLQQVVTINNDVNVATSASVQLTTSGQTLAVLAGLIATNLVKSIIITNIEPSSVLETQTLNLGTNTISLRPGAQIMLSGLAGTNVSTWTLLRTTANSTIPCTRIEFSF